MIDGATIDGGKECIQEAIRGKIFKLLLHFQRISSLMILDLEAEKAMDSRKCFGVVSGYPQLCTMLSILCLIRDLALQSLHVLYSRWIRGMYKHPNGKVTLGELHCDHRQVLADSLLACRISGVVTLYLNSTTIRKKMEMVSRLLVTKTHTLIATSFYGIRMFVLSGGRLLGY
jgi:hypothetical protein